MHSNGPLPQVNTITPDDATGIVWAFGMSFLYYCYFITHLTFFRFDNRHNEVQGTMDDGRWWRKMVGSDEWRTVVMNEGVM